MPTPLRPSLPRLSSCLAVLLFCCAGVAQAQFVWIGPNGTRVYSDQPPPPGTPASKILKAPGRAAAAQEAPDTPAASEAAKPKMPTLAEREADYRKRAREREESDNKSQAEAKRTAAHAEYCAGARKNARLYQSGIRIADLGPDGQKRYLSDAERAAASERAAQQLNECR
jgi:type IV secretory pathway VirB10-like protein